jgi:hypothetical protein
MTNPEFAITASWPSSPQERARDVADIRIMAEGQTLTRLLDLDKKEERDFVRASALSLALWLADNWWRLRYESLPDNAAPTTNWRLRHELTSASGGTHWPPLMIHSTGDRILFTRAFAGPVDVGSIRYIVPGISSAKASCFETGLDEYFKDVLRQCGDTLDGRALQTVIEDLRHERSDPATSAWRRLEARLGYDPGTAPDELITELASLEDTVGEDVLDEAASATPGTNAASHLRAAIEAVNESDIEVDFSIAESARNAAWAHPDCPPWEAGRAAASRIREEANLPDGPVRMTAFSDLFRMNRDDLGAKRATARHLRYSARADRRGKQKVALQAADLRDRRFELACLLGDQIWHGSAFGLSTKAKTDRQKFQRAFAQNLLAPYAAVRSTIDDPGPDQIDHAARIFHVHPNVIRRLMIIEGVIPEETYGEILETA